MKRLIVVAVAALPLMGCGQDPGAANTRGLTTITGGPAMRYNAGGGVIEASEADRYNYLCKDSPKGSDKVSYDGNGVPICVSGVYRYSELCHDSYKGSKVLTWVIPGKYGCYDGNVIAPEGKMRLLP